MDKLKLKLQIDSLWSYFCKIESEAMIVAAHMELNGIGFDSKNEGYSSFKAINR